MLAARSAPLQSQGPVYSHVFRMLRNSEDSYLWHYTRKVLDTQRADLGKYAVFFKNDKSAMPG